MKIGDSVRVYFDSDKCMGRGEIVFERRDTTGTVFYDVRFDDGIGIKGIPEHHLRVTSALHELAHALD